MGIRRLKAPNYGQHNAKATRTGRQQMFFGAVVSITALWIACQGREKTTGRAGGKKGLKQGDLRLSRYNDFRFGGSGMR